MDEMAQEAHQKALEKLITQQEDEEAKQFGAAPLIRIDIMAPQDEKVELDNPDTEPEPDNASKTDDAMFEELLAKKQGE